MLLVGHILPPKCSKMECGPIVGSCAKSTLFGNLAWLILDFSHLACATWRATSPTLKREYHETIRIVEGHSECFETFRG